VGADLEAAPCFYSALARDDSVGGWRELTPGDALYQGTSFIERQCCSRKMKDGTRDTSIEEFLQREIEDPGLGIIERLKARDPKRRGFSH